jgi:hypothetical protein
MCDLSSKPVQIREGVQEREARQAREKAAERAEANIFCLPRAAKPRTAAELQRWLDMCG